MARLFSGWSTASSVPANESRGSWSLAACSLAPQLARHVITDGHHGSSRERRKEMHPLLNCQLSGCDLMDSLVWVDQKVAEADGGGAAMKNPFFDTSLPCPSRRSWLWLSTLGLISTCTYLSVANSEIYSPCVSAAQMLCSANHLHCVIFLIGRWQSATNLLNCSLSFDRRHCDLQWRRIVGRWWWWWWMKTSSDDIIILFSLQVHNRSEMQFITFVLGSYGVHNLRWTLYEGGRRSLIRHNTHAMPINGPSGSLIMIGITNVLFMQ